MAYVPNTWATGDVITAEKLNHMENGIEALEVNLTINMTSLTITNITSNVSCQTLYNALNAGKRIVAKANFVPETTGETFALILNCTYGEEENQAVYEAFFAIPFNGGYINASFMEFNGETNFEGAYITGACLTLTEANNQIVIPASLLARLVDINSVSVTKPEISGDFTCNKIIYYSKISNAYSFITGNGGVYNAANDASNPTKQET